MTRSMVDRPSRQRTTLRGGVPPMAPRGEHFLSARDASRRGLVLLLVSVVLLSVFAVRLIDLQVINGTTLANEALDQRLRTESLPVLRGSILDANGQPLAVTVDARNVTADQTLIDDPAAVGAALAPVLGADAAVLATRLTGSRRFVYVAKGVTPEVWSRIADLQLPGIFSQPTTRRLYPAGDVGANVIGFVGAEGRGLEGVEYAFQDQLAGIAGSRTYERGPGGRVIPTAVRASTDAQPGVDVQLTIDRDMQYVAQRALRREVERTGAASGTVVVMDPRTGQILALASYPTFDANAASSAPAEVRTNRALTDTYEPGSTSKVMTLAAVIDQGMASAKSTFRIPPKLRRGGETFQDHDPHGVLQLTLAGIMAKSSNIGSILAAERIGGRSLHRYLRKFGIGEKSGLGLPGEAAGKLMRYEDWNATSFPTMSFGQGYTVTAIQAASVYATIANDGVRVQPSLVKSVIRADGVVVRPPAPQTTRVVSADTARQVRAILEAVVEEGGTGTAAAIPGYRVGGKTGTANYVDDGSGQYSEDVVASFIGMAPADKPRLVVAVSVVAPQKGRYGGKVAAPVFKRVMSYALQAQGIPPTGSAPARLRLTYGKDS